MIIETYKLSHIVNAASCNVIRKKTHKIKEKHALPCYLVDRDET